MDFETSTIDKVFKNIKIRYKDTSAASIGTLQVFVDDNLVTFTNSETITNEMITYKFPSARKKGKKMQIKIIDCQTEIDAIGIVYSHKMPK